MSSSNTSRPVSRQRVTGSRRTADGAAGAVLPNNSSPRTILPEEALVSGRLTPKSTRSAATMLFYSDAPPGSSTSAPIEITAMAGGGTGQRLAGERAVGISALTAETAATHDRTVLEESGELEPDDPALIKPEGAEGTNILKTWRGEDEVHHPKWFREEAQREVHDFFLEKDRKKLEEAEKERKARIRGVDLNRPGSLLTVVEEQPENLRDVVALRAAGDAPWDALKSGGHQASLAMWRDELRDAREGLTRREEPSEDTTRDIQEMVERAIRENKAVDELEHKREDGGDGVGGPPPQSELQKKLKAWDTQLLQTENERRMAIRDEISEKTAPRWEGETLGERASSLVDRWNDVGETTWHGGESPAMERGLLNDGEGAQLRQERNKLGEYWRKPEPLRVPSADVFSLQRVTPVDAPADEQVAAGAERADDDEGGSKGITTRNFTTEGDQADMRTMPPSVDRPPRRVKSVRLSDVDREQALWELKKPLRTTDTSEKWEEPFPDLDGGVRRRLAQPDSDEEREATREENVPFEPDHPWRSNLKDLRGRQPQLEKRLRRVSFDPDLSPKETSRSVTGVDGRSESAPSRPRAAGTSIAAISAAGPRVSRSASVASTTSEQARAEHELSMKELQESRLAPAPAVDLFDMLAQVQSAAQESEVSCSCENYFGYFFFTQEAVLGLGV